MSAGDPVEFRLDVLGGIWAWIRGVRGSGPIATFSTDASGNVAGLVSPSGGIRDVYYSYNGDGIGLSDVSTTSASPVVTSVSASFQSSDIGKKIVIGANGSIGSGANQVQATIISVNSPNSVNVSPSPNGTLTGVQAYYGTECGVSINALLQLAKSSIVTNIVHIYGICLVSVGLTVPRGVILEGSGNTPNSYQNNTFVTLSGSSIIGCTYQGSSALVFLGDVTSPGNSPLPGAAIRNINIDAFNLYAFAVDMSKGQGSVLQNCTVYRGYSYVVVNGNSAVVDTNTIASQNKQGVLWIASPDSRVINNAIWGAGTSYACILVSAQDTMVSQNHVWKDTSQSGSTGPLVRIQPQTGNTTSYEALTITGNVWDSAFGATVEVNLTAIGTYLRGVLIANNVSLQGDGALNTAPYISLTTLAGVTITAITRNSATSSTVTAAAHGMVNNDYVAISGTTPAAMSGVFKISNITTNTFDITTLTDPVGNATVVGSYSPTVIGTLAISANMGASSFGNAESYGKYTYFIDGSGLKAGTVLASSVTGNVIGDVQTGLYNSFTPSVSTGNVVRLTNFTTVTG